MNYYKKTLFYLLVIIITVWSIFPFLWILLTSIKPPFQIMQLPPVFPTTITLAAYKNVLLKSYFPHYLFNSFMVSLSTVFITIPIALLAAYSISRFSFRRKTSILFMIIILFTLPSISLVAALYKLFYTLGWINLPISLIVTYSANNFPLAFFLLVKYLDKIPTDMDCAALIDGCTYFQAFRYIITPLSLPGVISASVLIFIFCWNEFLFALTFTLDESSRLASVGIALFQGTFEVPWGDIAAASVIVTLPLLLFLLFFQKYIVQGLTAGALKG
ncbi:MAG: carbohydrate ABC transporter permease [Candidatus Jettenia sp.]|uniref:ABC transporter permease component n=1 Tax=Candidatus Jettenia caeni TaxID=247490 RepID=I3IQ95_9BACT|nr:carbohydrate ABC transporter permease [Candidatus Jettenia sp. AMX1]MBC6928006.1 carbohydrate ABC transporter permease [Candidatus Jettenia sp.]NUN23833.1 carbohydrate ABC transporter permease [Candidatus Jettenia caeni]KAA0248867.1 MAG: carbohydrate ABC transporter permease [Candidatus Jettenia sp. AMX1]MCE7881015.1 carbohydrate ABC transporter permease [Candidatus Jettenia sp. AMX1]MDL1939266.1 carbohydrate ABC transporter permease [Candidatus Jettenia sp. AMX1]